MEQVTNKFYKESVDINKIKNIKTIYKHNHYVYSLLILSDGRLASCSHDGTINIYDIKNNYHCDITITINTGYTHSVNYIFELKNNKLISCSHDQSLKIWSIKIWSITESSYECDYTIKDSHDIPIYKVISLRNNKIASCSGDKTIKIWNSKHPYNFIKVLKGHTSAVISIIELKDKDILISVSRDKTIRKWNLLTYECDTIINDVDCCSYNSILEIDNNRIIVGGGSAITIVNISNDIIEQKIKKYELSRVYSLLQLRDGNILCGCENGRICLYDIKLNTISVREDKIHNEAVPCLLNINKNKFISCSHDNTIKVWEY